MLIKEEKGLTGIDIVISTIILTIFIALIANLITKINLNSADIKRKTIATSYAVQELEQIKAQGYISSYNGQGVTQEDTLTDADIYNSNGDATGFHKKITIKDYVLIKNDSTKTKNIVKEIIVEISYRLGNKDKSIKISTYIAH